ncbi:MAG: HIT family protein [Muribaculaceae bacterium]|nr:HIT family protein [Bacteroidales bacterium]MDY4811559.1 HIT family protein [Muribaculaceae bacterium]
MATLFSRIAAGEIPSYKVAEDKDHFAFLDINPVHPGHVLVIPRKETDYIFDLSDEELSSLMLFAKRVAKAIKKAIPCKKVGITVIGLDVNHCHVHLVPMNTGADMNFCAEKLTLPEEEMKQIAAKISAAFE